MLNVGCGEVPVFGFGRWIAIWRLRARFKRIQQELSEFLGCKVKCPPELETWWKVGLSPVPRADVVVPAQPKVTEITRYGLAHLLHSISENTKGTPKVTDSCKAVFTSMGATEEAVGAAVGKIGQLLGTPDKAFDNVCTDTINLVLKAYQRIGDERAANKGCQGQLKKYGSNIAQVYAGILGEFAKVADRAYEEVGFEMQLYRDVRQLQPGYPWR
ncbi:MAG: hypothetical protein AAFV29_13730 [Myxococcota bacterium]